MSKFAQSHQVDDFLKCVKKHFDTKDAKKLYQTIARFEQAENEFLQGQDPARQKLNAFGKTLSKIGFKDIYCLEIGTDRALAQVVERGGVKLFVWYWAGSHEQYNNVLKQMVHNKPKIKLSDDQIDQIIDSSSHDGSSSSCAPPDITGRIADRRSSHHQGHKSTDYQRKTTPK